MEPDVTKIRRALRITCADALELMTEFLEEALQPGDRERLEHHLDGCEACAVYLDQLRKTVTVVRAVGGRDEFVVDDATMSGLLARYRGARRQS